MDDIRETFLRTAEAVRSLLAAPRLRERWEAPSALAGMRVAGLAGHLLRAVTTVEGYLAGPPPDAEPVTAAAYFAVVLDPDLTSAANLSIRERGEAEAAGGPDAVLERLDGLIARLRERLRDEPPDRRLTVGGGLCLRLDDYLITRIVELCIHADDLAVSLDLTPPALPPAATSIAIETLVNVARLRHDDTAVLRALARRERDAPAALRVL